MSAPAVDLRLAQAHEITDTSILRICGTDYPVTSIHMTPSGVRVVQMVGRPVQPFMADDIVTLVDAAVTRTDGEVAQP